MHVQSPESCTYREKMENNAVHVLKKQKKESDQGKSINQVRVNG